MQKPKEYYDLDRIESISDFGDLKFELRIQKKTFMLQAESQAEHACWIKDLSKFINDRNDYDTQVDIQISLRE